MSAPEPVRTALGVWTYHMTTKSGDELYALNGSLGTLAPLSELKACGAHAVESAPVPVVPEPRSYPPAFPWARLMDAEDLADFLDELAAAAIMHASHAAALAEVERTCARWRRRIAEAQHGHNAAPGPAAAKRAARESDPGRRAAYRMLAEDVPDGEHYAVVHHDYRPELGRDLPETGGAK